jgi:hypothetical protein
MRTCSRSFTSRKQHGEQGRHAYADSEVSKARSGVRLGKNAGVAECNSGGKALVELSMRLLKLFHVVRKQHRLA